MYFSDLSSPCILRRLASALLTPGISAIGRNMRIADGGMGQGQSLKVLLSSKLYTSCIRGAGPARWTSLRILATRCCWRFSKSLLRCHISGKLVACWSNRSRCIDALPRPFLNTFTLLVELVMAPATAATGTTKQSGVGIDGWACIVFVCQLLVVVVVAAVTGIELLFVVVIAAVTGIDVIGGISISLGIGNDAMWVRALATSKVSNADVFRLLLWRDIFCNTNHCKIMNAKCDQTRK